ncbi:prolyl oligopeptidase family serine peptidase [soil metagenome]
MNTKYLLLLLLIPVAYIIFSLYQGKTISQQVAELAHPQEMVNKNISPTLFPYQELTIPYLRTQDFSSKLSEREFASENSTYTTYLTSYTSEGLRVNGLLTVPKGVRPANGWPAIIFIHGYIPPRQYNPFERYTDYVDYLARNGFVVFKIDLRGHAYSEGEAGGGYYGADYVKDTLAAYSALQHADFVNSKKIGLWGHSMAGNIVMRTAAIKPKIPAVAIWAGAVYSYTDLQKYKITDSSYVRQNPSITPQQARQRMIAKVGQPDRKSVFWQQFAPTNYLSDLKGAIQIHHAVDDDVVNIGYSRDLIALLDKTKVPHELYEYPSGGHNISGVSFGQAMERTVAFYKKYLQ